MRTKPKFRKEDKMKKNGGLLALVVFVLFAWVFCTGGGLEPAKTEAAGAQKAAFIYVGPIGDLGWTWEHDRGRKMLEAELGSKVETTYIESVPEGPDAARVIRQYAQQGYKVVFATSFGYMDPMVEVAQDFPGVYFEHCSGYKTAPNMSTYFGRMYQPRYLSGIVAGKMTKTNVIGYVAAFPIPEVIRGINAFTLGARSINSDVQVRVVWTSTWFDPVKEREAAVALLDAGADIIAQHQDTTEPQKAAEERGLLSIGYDSDMRGFVGDSVLVSPVWNWGSYYVDTVKAILDGSWKTHQYWGGLKEGIVQLSSFSPKVPQEVRDMVAAKQQAILKGTWDVFYGPIIDQGGKQVVPAGGQMSDVEMLNMSFFVEGVIGKAGQ
jgi:basic membrane protein A